MAGDRGRDFYRGPVRRYDFVDVQHAEISRRGMHGFPGRNGLPQWRRVDEAGSAAHRYRVGLFRPGRGRLFQLPEPESSQRKVEAITPGFSMLYS